MHSVFEAWVSLQLTNSESEAYRNWSFTNKIGTSTRLLSFIFFSLIFTLINF